MNLIELQKEKLPVDEIPLWLPSSLANNKPGYMENVRNYLQDMGFRPIGKGAFGIIYEHPKLDYVIKFFKDDAYLDFIKFCENNKMNPYLPKFRGKMMKSKKYPDINAIRMEKLTNIPVNINQTFYQYMGTLYDIRRGYSWVTWDKIEKDLKNFFPQLISIFTQEFFNLLKTLNELRPYAWDITGNIMFRESNKKLVITDPWA